MKLVEAALRAFVRGNPRDGANSLSPQGRMLEKAANYIQFVTRNMRLEHYYASRPELTNGGEKPPAGSLAYDVGANNGDDTAFYLRKGMNVVAIEANPALARHLATRFALEIAEDRVRVLNIALVGDDRPSVDFFVHKSNDQISTSIDQEVDAGQFSSVPVNSSRLSKVIEEFGEPYFLKIDIEGADLIVIREIFNAGFRPKLISVEAHSIEILAELVAAGYTKFKIVEGRFVSHPRLQGDYPASVSEHFTHAFPEHASGPFGDDIPGPWLTVSEAFKYFAVYGAGWKDVHAKRHDALHA